MLPFVRKCWRTNCCEEILPPQDYIAHQRFKLWMMVEIPANVILLESFIKAGIDGVSIGSQ